MVLDFEVVTVANAAIGRSKLGVVGADDSRLNDARPPLPHAHGQLAERDLVDTGLIADQAVTWAKLQTAAPMAILANIRNTYAAPTAVSLGSEFLVNAQGQLSVRQSMPLNVVLTDGANVLVGHGNMLWGPS